MFAKSMHNSNLALTVIKRFASFTDAAMRSHMVSANFLARHVAYELDNHMIPENNYTADTLNIVDEDGILREYSARSIYLPIKGLVCHVLITSEPQNVRMHLTFRGTKDLPACMRDLEEKSPGQMSFYEHKDMLLQAIANIIEQQYQRKAVHLIISGHSLGGADAQNFLASVMQAMAQLHHNNASFKSFAPLMQITQLTTNISNSAGITNFKAVEAKLDANFLAKEHQVIIHMMYIITAGDIVQQSGQNHILATRTPDVAQVTLVKILTPWQGWFTAPSMAAFSAAATLVSLPVAAVFGAAAMYVTFNAHKTKFTHEQQSNEFEYEIFTNNTELGAKAIADKLAKHALDNMVSSGFSKVPSLIFTSKTSRSPSPSVDEDYVFVENDRTNIQSSEDYPLDNSCCVAVDSRKLQKD